jgi:lipoprotein-anchoring transpeptidase ErfK/SrfK
MWQNFTVKSTTILAQEISAKITQQLVALKNSQKRWIEIDLSSQSLTAWEGDKLIQTITISTGKKSTPTLPGVFTIQSKRPIDRMRGADYDVPDVPYAMYYYRGYAIHGAYWHNKFGTPVSHGCINLKVDQAKWLFNWSSVGTSVVIHQ